MSLKNRLTEVIELPLTAHTRIPLRFFLLVIPPTLDDAFRITMRAFYALRPPDCSHCFVTLGIINQVLNVDHVSFAHFTTLSLILTLSPP
jgi:hypothetical protein